MKHSSALKTYMPAAVATRLGNSPTLHSNCLAIAGVARPGKTRKDKDKGSQRFGPNKRG